MRISIRIVRSEVAASTNKLVAHKEFLTEQKVLTVAIFIVE